MNVTGELAHHCSLELMWEDLASYFTFLFDILSEMCNLWKEVHPAQGGVKKLLMILWCNIWFGYFAYGINEHPFLNVVIQKWNVY